MATLASEWVNEAVTGFIESSGSALAAICFIIKPVMVMNAVSKIEVIASLAAKWEILYHEKKLYPDKIMIQVGYAGSDGGIVYKNSGLVVNKGTGKEFRPMLWVKDNDSNQYQTAFAFTGSPVLLFKYQLLFKINRELPAALQEAYCGEQEVTVNTRKPAGYYSIKISLN